MTFKVEEGRLYFSRKGEIKGPFVEIKEWGDARYGKVFREIKTGWCCWSNGRSNFNLEQENDLTSEVVEDTGSEPPDYLFQRDSDV